LASRPPSTPFPVSPKGERLWLLLPPWGKVGKGVLRLIRGVIVKGKVGKGVDCIFQGIACPALIFKNYPIPVFFSFFGITLRLVS
jgi:hypothetical protein